MLPLALAAVGILVSIIGTFFVRVKDGGDPHTALNIGEFGSAGVMVVISYFIITYFLPEAWSFNGTDYSANGVFFATLAGLIAGLGIGKLAASALEAAGRQPEAAGSLQTMMIIAAALIEGVAFFGLVVCLLLVL